MDLQERRAVEGILGYRFRDPRHLEAALTHGSRREDRPEANIEDYERLEFLGDAVLQIVVSDHFFRENPRWREGDLTKARSRVVAAKPLAAVARRLGLNGYVQAGASVVDRPGRGQERILSDVMEAVVGAVYADSGSYETVADVIRRCVLTETLILPMKAEPPPRRARRARPRRAPAERPPARPAARRGRAPARPPARPAARPVPAQAAPGPRRDFKSEIHDLLQKRHEPRPEYRVLREVGPEHEKVWIVQVTVGDRLRCTGKGRTKGEAEQRAAREALARFHGEVARRRDHSPV